MGGICSRCGVEERSIQCFGWKVEGMRQFGRPRRRWEYNIKMDLQEVLCGGRKWIDLAQDRDKWQSLVNAVMKLRVL
jgi:hypothetical protein